MCGASVSPSIYLRVVGAFAPHLDKFKLTSGQYLFRPDRLHQLAWTHRPEGVRWTIGRSIVGIPLERKTRKSNLLILPVKTRCGVRSWSNCGGGERVWCELYLSLSRSSWKVLRSHVYTTPRLYAVRMAHFLTDRFFENHRNKIKHFAYRHLFVVVLFLFFLLFVIFYAKNFLNILFSYYECCWIHIGGSVAASSMQKIKCDSLTHARWLTHTAVRESKYRAFAYFRLGRRRRWLAWDSASETRSLGGVSVVDLLPAIMQQWFWRE